MYKLSKILFRFLKTNSSIFQPCLHIGFLKPLPTLPSSLVYNFGSAAQRKTVIHWYSWKVGIRSGELCWAKWNTVKNRSVCPGFYFPAINSSIASFQGRSQSWKSFPLPRLFGTNTKNINKKLGRTVPLSFATFAVICIYKWSLTEKIIISIESISTSLLRRLKMYKFCLFMQ
jgi:hypothetical protein